MPFPISKAIISVKMGIPDSVRKMFVLLRNVLLAEFRTVLVKRREGHRKILGQFDLVVRYSRTFFGISSFNREEEEE